MGSEYVDRICLKLCQIHFSPILIVMSSSTFSSCLDYFLKFTNVLHNHLIKADSKDEVDLEAIHKLLVNLGSFLHAVTVAVGIAAESLEAFRDTAQNRGIEFG